MTDFKKVKVRLRAALKEYKKDEHDQLTTSLSRRLDPTPFSSERYLPATWEEACNSLIRSACIVQGREKSGFYDGASGATMDQEKQCGTCESIDCGKAQDPCYTCVDFSNWQSLIVSDT